MNGTTARALRRETKRTLGAKLTAFATGEHQRLVAVEGITAAQHQQLLTLNVTLGQIEERLHAIERTARLTALRDRTFIGRLRRLFLGR